MNRLDTQVLTLQVIIKLMQLNKKNYDEDNTYRSLKKEIQVNN
jgi:hypothetical protein